MLELVHVRKSYVTSAFTQVALDDVSLAFRDNEFVSILGPSGSGKTTLLNVIGGLDHFDEGDLIIDGISTKRFRDRDWDAYRNNRIGFVFQSYNLIPHQTILANVELALTLSGVSSSERRIRARAALEKVGLGAHVDKRPSQLSGGQMQRVAIARALINDPEILLADEPTGALDSKTSVQVMDLLREVAADRLVIMVTHNPELAEQYSTRIVELRDGRIYSDSDPYEPKESDMRRAKPTRRTSMSFMTALSLSFNNLMTKLGRTLMTAFAGSIGIIGIAAILSLANGVRAYIQDVEERTLSAYPLQITSAGFDMTSLLVDMSGEQDEEDGSEGDGQERPAGVVGERRVVGSMFGSVGKNDLAALKDFLEAGGGGINDYAQDIECLFGVVPQIFADEIDGEVHQVNPDSSFSAFGFGSSTAVMSSSSSAFSTNVFSELPSNLSLVEEQFDVLRGRWPEGPQELVVVLSRSGQIADVVSYALGLRDYEELEDMVQRLANDEDFEVPDDRRTYTFEQLMAPRFRVLPAARFYVHEQDYNVWTSRQDDEEYLRTLLADALTLTIVGVVQPREDVDATTITQGIYYTPDLTRYLMGQAADSEIVRNQLDNPSINVITNKAFDAEAKERGLDFDMSSLVSIDEDRMAEAFSMDLGALNVEGIDFSGLSDALDFKTMAEGVDLSGMEMPQMDFSAFEGIDLSQLSLDFSSLDVSSFDLTSFDWGSLDFSDLGIPNYTTEEVIALLMPTLEQIDAQQIFEGVMPLVDEERLRNLVSDLSTHFVWYMRNQPCTLPSTFVTLPEVHERLRGEMKGIVKITEIDVQIITDNLARQLGDVRLTDAQYAALNGTAGALLSSLGSQVGGALAEQFGPALASSLSDALSGAIGEVVGTYFEQIMANLMTQMGSTLEERIGGAIGSTIEEAMGSVTNSMGEAFSIDEQAFAEAFSFNMDEEELAQLMRALTSTERSSYENNLAKFGYADARKPVEIDIYPRDFDSKDQIIAVLEAYNERMREEDEDKVITYTDLVGALMSSVTDIVDKISYVLIAFVAISLVVSSIMIGVITYISVLERKKEIGILRSIGASKRDVSTVFIAETVIEGLVSGLMGVTITALVCIPVNIIVEKQFDVVRVARMPFGAAVALVGVSVALSFIAGLIPSRKAAKADPVEALRSE